MSNTDQGKFTFEVKERDSVSFIWELKSFGRFHKFLSSTVESFVNIEDVQLRFFLRPFEKTVKLPGYQEEIDRHYSLCAEIMSQHRKVNLEVKTTYFQLPVKYTQSYITLEKSVKNQNGTETIQQEFVKVAEWDVGNRVGHPSFPDYEIDFGVEIQVILYECVQVLPPKMGLPGTSFVKVGEKMLSTQIKEFSEENREIPFSDVTLQMKDNVAVKGHRLILSSASPVFKAMFMYDMKESQTRIVQIPDITSKAMNIIIRYIYSGELDSHWNKFLDELIYAADKYQLNNLLNYFDKNLISICNTGNVAILLMLANTHNLQTAMVELKKYAELHVVEILINQLETK